MEEEKKESTTPEKQNDMSNNSGMKGLVAGFVALVLLGGVAFGLYQWSSNGEGGSASAMTTEERTAAVAKKLSELESAQFSAKIDVKLGKNGSAELQPMTEVLGVTDEITNVVLSADGSMSDADDKKVSSVNTKAMLLDASGAEKASVGLNAMMIDTMTYLQLQPLPEPVKELAKSSGFDISFLENQWIELNIDEVVEQLGLTEEDLKQLEAAQFTKEEKEQLSAAFVNNVFLKLQGEPTEEEINGEKTLKYETTFDSAMFKAFLTEVKPVLVAKGMYKEEEYNAFLEGYDKEYQDFLGETTVSIYTWVGKKDNEFYKGEITLMPKSESDKADLEQLMLTLELRDHGKAVSVEAPTDTMNLQELIGQFALGLGASGGQLAPATDTTDTDTPVQE